jgi:RimJ/RimL family protein N-acetyltransferase
MNAAEFGVYVERSIPEYAQDKVDSGQWSKESSLELSRREFEESLPQGAQTPDNFLFTVRDAATQVNVGMLWYAIQEQAGQRIAYVYDVLVEPPYQRKGYATRAFEALGIEVHSRGLCGIALNVFGHNRAARALYAKLGFQTTSTRMFKKVPSAGT